MRSRVLLGLFALASALVSPDAHICNPAVGCNVCAACCQSWIPDQNTCDACVSSSCQPNICDPSKGCNVCAACCLSWIGNQDACDACTAASCSGPSPPGPSPPGPSPPAPTPGGPPPPPPGPPGAFVGGYILLGRSSKGQIVGLDELRALANAAATLPVTRLWLSFFSPTMVYVPGSNTLIDTGLNVSKSADAGFAEIKSEVTKLQAGGVEVFLSMGGWNYNCFPYLYTRYSVGGYGTSTPNFWKVQKYANGNLAGCTAANQFCYTCEPKSEGTSLNDFAIFPEPAHSPTWKAAVQLVEASSGGVRPVWTKMVIGSRWTDPKTGVSTTVPGNPKFLKVGRDPYADIVHLAKDMGAAGIDLDYEEFWHADFHKTGAAAGPYKLDQTVFKYTAIAKDMQLNIQAIYPKCKLSTAAGAVGAWSGNWWGGNMKGVWLQAHRLYPSVINFMAKGPNSGGVNIMSYDLSKNMKYHECPEDGVCALDKQVEYYMATYTKADIEASVGYEIGSPAYPDITHDKSNQLPLTKAMLQSMIQTTQPKHKAGFFWEMFKPTDGSDRASPTEVAQAICKVVMPNSPRCSGTIPPFNGKVLNVTGH